QAKGEKVEPGFPSVLPTLSPPPSPVRANLSTSGRRHLLADWIANLQNPLTARVLMNRLWQYHFGRGIVRSSSNFGYQGTPPTHPELLDWLAAEFVHPSPQPLSPFSRDPKGSVFYALPFGSRLNGVGVRGWSL